MFHGCDQLGEHHGSPTARIRAQSKSVAEHISADPEAKAFMDDWATPEPISH